MNKNVQKYKWLNSNFSQPVKSQSITKLIQIIEKNKDSILNINIYGGEPSIDTSFIDLMDNLKHLKIKAKLTIVSNGVWPNDNIGKKFEHTLYSMKKVGWNINLKISLDGVQETAEFIRHPTKWSVFENNFKVMIENKFCSTVNITTSLYNINNHYEISDYLLSNSWSSKITPVINLASTPSIISIANLGHYILNFKKSYIKIPDHPLWKDYKKWLESVFLFQQNGNPNVKNLTDFIEFTEWYSFENSIEIPSKLKENILFLKTILN
jgi:sulfatase maturation enzyme AslB (radical SAM superfamily)